eukprot:9930795-Ditylum_brightwellii.AAC.1
MGWTWELPPLNRNRKWFKARRAKLWEVTEAIDNKAKLCKDAMRTLRCHVDTFNFITYPPPMLTPNPLMSTEQQKVAAAFVDELNEIGAVKKVSEGSKLCTNSSLLKVVPKPGQPSEWRVLPVMRKGRQNDHIVPDPVHYPCMPDILPCLFPGRYSVVINEQLWYIGLQMGSVSSPGKAGQKMAAVATMLQ